PLVTIAVPSFNQGRYLETALASIFAQEVPVEVFVLDAGSTDGSVAIIQRWSKRLAGWRSHPDAGQAAAINEGIAQGRAPYVA
ncbi:MAG: glycosyltransferase, partial [Rhodocyclaceae bacterium]|nr:glycosyltransferase [Rhodocyclaceae bacterium]